MAYRRCSCGAITDITDEKKSKCSCCGKNPLNNGSITLEELILGIKQGKIVFSQVWTKRPDEIRQALLKSPS